jgi:hypothetical protein
MTEIIDMNKIDQLVDLLDDPSYDPFEVSRAMELVANGKVVVTIKGNTLVLTPCNDNFHYERRFA